MLRPSRIPRLLSAPRMRVYPQLVFSVAIRTTSCTVFCPGSWAARSAPSWEGPLPGYQLSVPAEQGSRGDNRVKIPKSLEADTLGDATQGPAFGIGEDNAPTAEAAAQRTVLCFEVLDPNGGISFQPCGDASRE